MWLRLLTMMTWLLAGAATAQPSPEDLRALAFAGDIAGLERTFADLHAGLQAGTATIDDLRLANASLIVTHPTVVATAHQWLRQMPQSVYAKTLVANHLFQEAWQYRGERSPRDTYPDALDQFSDLKHLAFDLAFEAAREEPDYIPASDTVIRINRVSNRLWGYELDRFVFNVMDTYPNWATLFATAGNLTPQWGGRGASGTRKLCSRYLPRLPEWDHLTVESCAAVLTFMNQFPREDRNAAAHVLTDLDLEGQTFARIRAILWTQNRSRLPEVETFFRTSDVMPHNAVGLARDYEALVQTSDSAALVSLVRRKVVDASLAQLRYDPFDTDAIHALVRAGYDDKDTYDFLNSFDARIELAARYVAASPFDHARWSALANHVRVRDRTFPDDVGLPFAVNAIAFGGHRESYLLNLYEVAAFDFHLLIRGYRNVPTDPDALYAAKVAKVCLATRASRVHEATCGDEAEGGICLKPNVLVEEPEFVAMMADNARLCPHESSAPIQQLMFSPVPVGLSQYIPDLDVPLNLPWAE